MEKMLIIDDDAAINESLRFAFKDMYELFFATSSAEVKRIFVSQDIDITLLDLKLGNYDGMDLFSEIKGINPNAVIIIITAYGTIDSSINAIKKGAFHYLTKPIELSELKLFVEKGIIFNNLHKRINYLNEKLKREQELNGIIAKSSCMQKVLEIVEKIKDIDSNVLITGESGTGKEVIAKAVHYNGKRKNYNYEAINCSAIPTELLESELFGYVAGAFTGAQKNKTGRFEVAHKGTLLLDEIGEMDPILQSKLLRVIEEKTITPLGSNEKKNVDIRIIASTNRNLEDAVEGGSFREDLYYRLNVISIHLPPLRERKEDIPCLIKHFVQKYSVILNQQINSIDQTFVEYLTHYDFKGNIRELEHIIERAIALSDSDTLTYLDLPKPILTGGQIKSQENTLIPVFIGENLNTIEKKVIKKTYEFYKGNQKAAAGALGISDRTLRYKLKEI